MKFLKIGLDITILVTVVFLFVNTFFMLLEIDVFSYFNFFKSSGVYFSFAIISFVLSILLGYFFVSIHKKNMLSVRLKVKHVDVDTHVIKSYIQKSFQILSINIDKLDIEVDRSQKLYIHTSLHKLPDLSELEKIEKEIGGMLGSKLGYFKDFEMYFSQKN